MGDIRQFIVALGVREDVVSRVECDATMRCLHGFAQNHIGSPSLVQDIIKLIALETHDKVGAIWLSYVGIATCTQLRALSQSQVAELYEIYSTRDISEDEMHRANGMVEDMIITNQLEKMHEKSMGLKGEYLYDMKKELSQAKQEIIEDH